MNTTEYLKKISEDPTNVLAAEDGDYDYQPVSHLRNLLDEIYSGEWSWDLDRETIGKGEAIAKGTLSFRHPGTGERVHRSGTAALPLSKGLRLDYPKLSSSSFTNACKSIGKIFGRDLNKDKDDIPVVVVVKEDAPDEQFEAVKKTMLEIIELHGAAKAKTFLDKSGFRYHPELKALLELKNTNE